MLLARIRRLPSFSRFPFSRVEHEKGTNVNVPFIYDVPKMYKGLTRDRRDGCRIKKHCKNFVSTSSQFVQFVHGRTTIDVRYGNYKYFPPFNPLIFRLACSNSIASRAQHYSVPSITRNKSRRKFYHIEGGNYCSKSSPRIFCTFMEHPVPASTGCSRLFLLRGK